MPQRFTWNKAEKLKSRKRIDQVFKQGKSFSVFPFRVFYLMSGPGDAAASSDGSATKAAPGTAEAAHTAPATPKTAGGVPVQAGFTAGSRHFKKAVDRNRIKRLCREAYRLQKQPLVDHLRSGGRSMSVFFVYTGKDLPDHLLVSGKIGVILQKLVRETA